MYKGIPFSPQVALADNIGAGDTVIKVTDISAFPDAPNYATIGTDETGETIMYAAKTTDSLSGCTRGVEGTAKSWPAGSTIARNFTTMDFHALQDNIKSNKTAADNAQSSADAAGTAASNAQSTANQAVTAAGNAQTAADNAQSSADAASKKVDTVVGTVPKKPNGENQTVIDYIDSTITEITAPRFGVSGVGNSAAALTRLWDSVGKTFTVSTDTVTGHSDFDNYAPFNRKKCVGYWSKHNGKAKFSVSAYYGDADYREDGSMGDYVAVEVKPFYYYEKDGILGVSEQQYPGWNIHPVCVDYDGNIRENTYIPVYSLALNGNNKAVSLPGFYNVNGSYYKLTNYAKAYNNSSAASMAVLEPSAVNHYEWLLMVIEFATQNVQNVMTGASSMLLGDQYTVVAVPGANKIVVGSWGDSLVIGQSIGLTNNIWDWPEPGAYNNITNIQNCNADGSLNSSGSYRLITYGGANRTVTADSTKVASRPWRTGACTGYAGIASVKGHTGYPVANNGRYPCMYRYRENIYGNQYNTSQDLCNTLVPDGSSNHLEWYFLEDARKYTPSADNKPDASDLNGENTGWVKLDVITPASSYANGYIKEFDTDGMFPHVKIPVNTIGGSDQTYYCDYAYLVYTDAVRSVRRGGLLYDGGGAGPCCMAASDAPANGLWNYGGALHFIQ